jgi:hypothetical protein
MWGLESQRSWATGIVTAGKPPSSQSSFAPALFHFAGGQGRQFASSPEAQRLERHTQLGVHGYQP